MYDLPGGAGTGIAASFVSGLGKVRGTMRGNEPKMSAFAIQYASGAYGRMGQPCPTAMPAGRVQGDGK